MKQIYLAFLLAVTIAACNASDSETEPVASSEPSESTTSIAENSASNSNTTDSEKAAQGKGQTAPSDMLPAATSPSPKSSGVNAAGQTDAAPKKKFDDQAATTPSNADGNEAVAEIAIDETICGAGGQDAYFETRQQEIYICRSENQTLTYIATPKKRGNSIFLPAIAIQDGDKTAYLAEDGDRRFLVGPVGYRLEENGKAIAQERVIRSR